MPKFTREGELQAMNENNDKLLTTSEVAAIFRVAYNSVIRWGDQGKLTVIRTPGGHRRHKESEVKALLEGKTGVTT